MHILAGAIASAIGSSIEPQPSAPVHGGSINECYRWEGNRGTLFVKIADARRLPMLEAEAEGLAELGRAAAVRVPRVLAVGRADAPRAGSSSAESGAAFLVLEWIDLSGGTRAAEAQLGAQLARQHRRVAPACGWHRDNTIGSTPQPNAWDRDWIAFFRERRLRHQLDLARHNGHRDRLQQRGAELLERMDGLFDSHRPAASLLHGDLWGGNWGVDAAGEPVIFDPAVYYGDREADLAMTRLFGGFGSAFREAYEAAWPLDPGAELRSTLYNLYHILNHLNLFGGGYGRQAESMIDRLLAALGH
jgi:protein-ribulosamine 3-kinase